MLRRATTALLTAGLLATGLATTAPQPVAQAQEAADRTGRLAGPDRYATAVEISKHAFPNGAPVVHIARGDVYVDALAGGVLTAGPILLVRTHGPTPQAVLDEVDRLGAKTVIALGGPRAVSPQVLTEVARGRTTKRLAGPDRYATAVAISRHQFPSGAPTAYLAPTEAAALAMAVAPDGPILLVPPSQGHLPTAVRDELRRLAPKDLRVVGGLVTPEFARHVERETWPQGGGWVDTPWVADAVELAAAMAGRFHTRVEVARAYVARADDPVDALAGGVLADGPVLLAPPCGTSEIVDQALTVFDPEVVVALGGPGAVCNAALAHYGGRARAPIGAPGLSGVRTLRPGRAAPPDAHDVTVGAPAWSRHGSVKVWEESWMVGDEWDDRRSAWIVEHVDGRTVVIDTPPGVPGHGGLVGVAADGSRFWLNHYWSGGSAVWEYATDGSTRRQVLDRAADRELGGSGVLHRGTLLDLETMSAWAPTQDRSPTLYGRDADWAIHHVGAGANQTYREVLVSRPDTPDAVLLPASEGRCGPIRNRVEAASRDLRRLVVVQAEPLPTEADGSCARTTDHHRLVVLDASTGATAQLPVPNEEGLSAFGQGMAHLTGDGRTVVISWNAPLPMHDHGGSHWGLTAPAPFRPDGQPFPGAPTLDGDRAAGLLADVDTLLAGEATWSEIPWGTQKPQVFVRTVGHDRTQLAWAVDGPLEQWPDGASDYFRRPLTIGLFS